MVATAAAAPTNEDAVEALSAAIRWHGRASAASADGDAAAAKPPPMLRAHRPGHHLPLPALRRLGNTLLEEAEAELEAASRADEEAADQEEQQEEELSEDAALWLEQMLQNYNAGNMDLADLADTSSVPTLLRLLRVPDPVMAAEVMATLAEAAAGASVLPPPTEWIELLTSLLAGVEPPPLERGVCAASWGGDAGRVGLLLAQPSPRTGPDARDANGNSALGLAALAGHTAVIKLLLAAKADTELANTAGATALHQAAWMDQAPAAIALLRAGAEVDAPTSTGAGDSPLAVAAHRNSAQVAALLLEARADHSTQNTAGETPLAAAATRGSVEVARLLLAAGASPTAAASGSKGRSGSTILDWATNEMIARGYDAGRSSKIQKRRLLIAEALIADSGSSTPVNMPSVGESEVVMQMVIVEGPTSSSGSADEEPCWLLPQPKHRAPSKTKPTWEPQAAGGRSELVLDQQRGRSRVCTYLIAWSQDYEEDRWVHKATVHNQPTPRNTRLFAAPIVVSAEVGGGQATVELLASLERDSEDMMLEEETVDNALTEAAAVGQTERVLRCIKNGADPCV